MKVFLKVPKKVFYNAKKVLDPLISLHMYFFIPKFLPKDPKMLNDKKMVDFRRMKNY